MRKKTPKKLPKNVGLEVQFFSQVLVSGLPEFRRGGAGTTHSCWKVVSSSIDFSEIENTHLMFGIFLEGKDEPYDMR